MTKQESFKRRVRQRMEKTGERYARARQVLIEQAAQNTGRNWVADPETTDEAVRTATGRGWDEWCDLIDGWPDRSDDHTAIAAHVATLDGVDQWWAQTITIGYERITGLRLPYQRADGTFTAGKSATIHVAAEELRELLLAEAGRADLFPGKASRLRSRPTSKTIRIEIGPGVVEISLDQKDDGRTRVAVAHERLPSYDDVEPWKFYWSEWLEAIGSVSKNNVSKNNVSKGHVSKNNVSKNNVSKDNVSKDNVSKDNVSKDNVSKDNVSKDNG